MSACFVFTLLKKDKDESKVNSYVKLYSGCKLTQNKKT